MLSILLLILKIIGIILLLILGILLLILLAILFVPIRYKAKGIFNDSEKYADGQISWAGFLIRIKMGYRYGEDFLYSVRILGLRVFSNDDEKTIFQRLKVWKENRARKKREKEKKKKTELSQERSMDGAVSEQYEPKVSIDDLKELEEKAYERPAKPVEIKEQSDKTDKTVEVPKEKWYNTFKNFIKRIVQKWKSFWEKFDELKDRSQEKKDLLEEKVEDIADRYETVERFYYKNRTQHSVQKLVRIVKKTVVYILPVSCKGKLVFGFSDPAITGKVYAACCVLGVTSWKGFFLKPEFNEMILEADMKVRGRVRVIFFVRKALTILLDKKMRMSYKESKKLFDEVLGGN